MSGNWEISLCGIWECRGDDTQTGRLRRYFFAESSRNEEFRNESLGACDSQMEKYFSGTGYGDGILHLLAGPIIREDEFEEAAV